MMSNERSSSRVPKTLRCCTCDGEEGPCAISKVVGFALQEQDAAFEPAFVLQGQPFYQQRGAPGQRHTACERRGEGDRERVSTYTQADRQSQHMQERAYHAQDPVSQWAQSKSQTHPRTVRRATVARMFAASNKTNN